MLASASLGEQMRRCKKPALINSCRAELINKATWCACSSYDGEVIIETNRTQCHIADVKNQEKRTEPITSDRRRAERNCDRGNRVRIRIGYYYNSTEGKDKN